MTTLIHLPASSGSGGGGGVSVPVTAAYTVGPADNGNTLALGGNSYYAVTFGTPTAGMTVRLVNTDLPPGGFTSLWANNVTYGIGDQVFANFQEFTSLTSANLGHNPSTDGGTHWRLGSLGTVGSGDSGGAAPTIWVSTITYTTGQQCVGTNGHAYTALSNTTNNNPTTDGGVHWSDNGALGRAKYISVPGGKSFRLYPQQTADVFVQAGEWIVRRPYRWQVPSTTIIYVDPAGVDGTGTDGLIPGAGAYMSMQYAYDALASELDFGYQNIFMQLMTGVFNPEPGSATDCCLQIPFSWTGGGSLIITGYPLLDGAGHMSSKVAAPAGGACIWISSPLTGSVQLGALMLYASSSSSDGVRVTAANSVEISNTEFGATGPSGRHVATLSGAQIVVNGSVWLVGEAAANFYADGASYIQTSNATITLAAAANGTGTGPVGHQFYVALGNSAINAQGTTYTGTFANNSAAYKYVLNDGGSLSTGGGGASSIPGANISRNNGGVIDTMRTQSGTFSTLTNPALAGDTGFITDATVSTFGTAVTVGGGASSVPVYWDGLTWRVG